MKAARAPVSPVAPRRTAVAGVLRSTDHSLPCAELHVSGVSYSDRLHPDGDEFKRLRTERKRAPVTTKAEGSRSAPSSRTHLGCRKRANGASRGGCDERNPCKSLVGAPGFEPGNSSLSGRSALYRRLLRVAERTSWCSGDGRSGSARGNLWGRSS